MTLDRRLVLLQLFLPLLASCFEGHEVAPEDVDTDGTSTGLASQPREETGDVPTDEESSSSSGGEMTDAPPPDDPTPDDEPTPVVGKHDVVLAPRGLDSNPCTVSAPCLTIAHASAKLVPGATLWVRGGTYNGQFSTWTETIWNAPAGEADAPVTIAAYPGEQPVFDGGVEPNACEKRVFLHLRDDGSGRMQNVVIRGLDVRRYYHGFWVHGARNITIEDCSIQPATEHGIYIYGDADTSNADITVRGNLFEGLGDSNAPSPEEEVCGHGLGRRVGQGIHANHGPQTVDGLRVHNNVFRSMPYAGTLIGAGATDVEIIHNTFVDNYQGIGFAYPGDEHGEACVAACGVVVRNNIVTGSAGYALRTGTIDVDFTADHNLYFDNGFEVRWNNENWTFGTFWDAVGGGQGSLTADPQLDATANLRPESPAVDAGSDADVHTDRFGTARPQLSGWDIGAHELR